VFTFSLTCNNTQFTKIKWSKYILLGFSFISMARHRCAHLEGLHRPSVWLSIASLLFFKNRYQKSIYLQTFQTSTAVLTTQAQTECFHPDISGLCGWGFQVFYFKRLGLPDNRYGRAKVFLWYKHLFLYSFLKSI